MLSVVIQAGGESRRMGKDKALMPFLGAPLIQRLIARLRLIADEMLITTNTPSAYQFLGLPLFPDKIPNRGALGGLFTALSASHYPLVAVIACDMPFINPTLLSAQREAIEASRADLAIPRTEQGLEPFHAIYRRETCLPWVHAALEEGRWRVDAWFDKVHLRIFTLEESKKYDPDLLSFMNVNTPEEFKKAEEIARKLDEKQS